MFWAIAYEGLAHCCYFRGLGLTTPFSVLLYWAFLKSSQPQSLVNNPRLIAYLQQDLGLSDAALALVSRQQQPTVTELPIVLWNLGLIDLEEVERTFDWLSSLPYE
jgi:Protein of unknown function (DUF2949)